MEFEGPKTLAIALVVSLLVGTVMGAIPGGGMIGEMLIVSLYGFPPEALPIIAAISTIIDPPATMLNVTADNACAVMTARLVEGKNWIKTNLLNRRKGCSKRASSFFVIDRLISPLATNLLKSSQIFHIHYPFSVL